MTIGNDSRDAAEAGVGASIPGTDPGPQSRSTPTASAAADAYSVFVARALFADFNIRYARLFEDLELDTGSCRRRIRLLWRLPTVESFAGDADGLPALKRLVVPLTIMRRGQLYTNLEVKAANGVKIRVVSRRSSTRLARVMLDAKWSTVLDELRAAGLAEDPAADLDDKVFEHITDVVDGLAREAREAVFRLETDYRRTVNWNNISRRPDKTFKEFIELAHRLGRRHIIWAELIGCQPGDAIELEYSYFTRFPDEHRTTTSRRVFTRTYESWKRWVGQPPSLLDLPISRHALSESYHVTFRVPDHNFLDRFEFVDLGPTGADAGAFAARAEKAGAQLSGNKDAGGPVGHLYCHQMPVGPRSAVQAKVMERPPGATASVAWLCLISSMITVALLFNWDHIFAPQPPRILQLALPIPGIAAIWFAHVFHIDSRRRLPVAARLGLYATVAMSAFLLVLFMFAAGRPGGESPLPRWSVIAIAAAVQGGTTTYAWYQRLHFYKSYWAHQALTAHKYGL